MGCTCTSLTNFRSTSSPGSNGSSSNGKQTSSSNGSDNSKSNRNQSHFPQDSSAGSGSSNSSNQAESTPKVQSQGRVDRLDHNNNHKEDTSQPQPEGSKKEETSDVSCQTHQTQLFPVVPVGNDPHSSNTTSTHSIPLFVVMQTSPMDRDMAKELQDRQDRRSHYHQHQQQQQQQDQRNQDQRNQDIAINEFMNSTVTHRGDKERPHSFHDMEKELEGNGHYHHHSQKSKFSQISIVVDEGDLTP
eukprot:PhF_6_TR6221/c1_g1_i1/m.9384